MSKEEKGNKGASDCCGDFDFGSKGIKDKMADCCGTEGEGPGSSSMFEKFKNSCCGHSEEEKSAGKDESKKG